MTIGAISTEPILPAEIPESQQSENSNQSEFSDILSKSTLSGGAVDLDAIFEAAGQRYNIPANLLKAVAKVESDFRPNVTSRSGAMGIMQLMPGTARGLGVTDAFDPEQNIMGGAKYLRQMLDQFDGDLNLALAAYNAGPNNVIKYGGIPPFTETQNYVKKVREYLSGVDLIAGKALYGRAGEAKGSSGSFPFGEALTQMLLIKIIEMQMNSSKDDKDRIF